MQKAENYVSRMRHDVLPGKVGVAAFRVSSISLSGRYSRSLWILESLIQEGYVMVRVWKAAVMHTAVSMTAPKPRVTRPLIIQLVWTWELDQLTEYMWLNSLYLGILHYVKTRAAGISKRLNRQLVRMETQGCSNGAFQRLFSWPPNPWRSGSSYTWKRFVRAAGMPTNHHF